MMMNELTDDQCRAMQMGINVQPCAGAYKNIDVVMAEQADLVAVLVELSPLGVIKA